jgi:hypothetical protein
MDAKTKSALPHNCADHICFDRIRPSLRIILNDLLRSWFKNLHKTYTRAGDDAALPVLADAHQSLREALQHYLPPDSDLRTRGATAALSSASMLGGGLSPPLGSAARFSNCCAPLVAAPGQTRRSNGAAALKHKPLGIES